ncbi:hypothetical protein SAMN04487846_1586 [Microbacterium sp. cf046]|nr:hypothetical protein SAMN04487846_1586 [Microbacterium sp. cf046]
MPIPRPSAPAFTQAYPGAPPQPAIPYAAHGAIAGQNDAPDKRPRALAFVSLGSAIVGVVLLILSLAAFVGVVMFYMPWWSQYLAGGVLIAAIVLAIIALGSRGQGGKRIGVAALIIAVAGGLLAAVSPAIIFILIVTADMRAF